jgi:hypothetical protein
MKRISINTLLVLLLWNEAGLHTLYGLGTLSLWQAGCIGLGIICADMVEDLAKLLKQLSDPRRTHQTP